MVCGRPIFSVEDDGEKPARGEPLTTASLAVNTSRYDVGEAGCDGHSGLPSGHVTNYAQNENGQVRWKHEVDRIFRIRQSMLEGLGENRVAKTHA